MKKHFSAKPTTKENHAVEAAPKAQILKDADLVAWLDALEQDIARRAFEIFEARGREPGRDVEDWLLAAQETFDPLPGNATEDGQSVTVRCFVPPALDVMVGVEPRRALVWVGRELSPSAAADHSSERQMDRRVFQFQFPELVDPSRPAVNISGQLLTITVSKASERKAVGASA